MKSTIFRKVLNEEYIEVNKSVSRTIEHLREMSVTSNELLPDGTEIHLRCSKKGKITVWLYKHNYFIRQTDATYPLYYVYGQVLSKDNKTYIKINSVFQKSEIYTEIFWSILAIVLFPLGIIFLLDNLKLKIPLALISLIIGFFGTVNYRSNIAARKSRGITLLPLMENEIKKRVELIEQWED